MANENQTVVYLSEQVVVLFSCALSFLGSSLIILTYIIWPDLRTTPRKLLVFLSVSDWLSAVSYAFGVWSVFHTDSVECVAQGAISTFANTSSFFWTVAIAVYLYVFIVRSSKRLADSLVLFFHLVSWGVPLAITVAALCLNKIGYDASEVSVGWCWVRINAPDRVLWMLLTGKIWEFLAYLTLPVLYILIKRHIHVAGKRDPAGQLRQTSAAAVVVLSESQNTAMAEREEWVKPVERRGRLTAVLALATLVSAFGSSFQYGYNVAVINSPTPFMQQFYNTTYLERYGSPMEDSFLTLLWSLSVSMYPLGGFFGSLMVAPLVNKLGRKGTLLFNNVFSIVPAVMMGVSEIAKSYEIIIVARFIVGICAGLSSNVVPMYLGELSPKNLRGALGIVPQLFITIGILSAQVLGIRNILGNTTGWPLMLGLTGIPALIELLLLPFFPESPRYMLIQRGDEKTAKKALQRLRGWEDVDGELAEMRLEDQSEKAEGHLSVLSLLSQRSLRWQLVSIIIMNMGQQLSGVNAIYYYADSIYASAGVKQNDIQYVTVGTGAVNVFMTVAAVFIVEASGRRLLLLCGFGICCGACVLLTIALNFQESVAWMPYVSIACVIIYVIGHAIGPSPIPYVVTTEMFRQSARPAAFMVAGSVHWLSNFTVGLVFPFLESGLGSFSFIIFAVICLITLIYIWLVVPETKSKTFLEVCQMFAKRNKVEIKLGDGDLPLKETKESLEDAVKVTAF